MINNKRLQPWLDLDMADRAGEEWRDVVSYDGMYEVSNHGRIKSVARFAKDRFIKGRIMKQSSSPKAAAVGLSSDGAVYRAYVMNIVADAFLVGKPLSHVWYHKNKNQFDNRVGNISHGTHSTSSEVNYAVGVSDPVRENGTTQGDFMKQDKARHEAEFGVFDGGMLVAKTCIRCFIERPIDEYARAGTQTSLRRICRTCRLVQQGVKDVGSLHHRMELAKAGLRICTTCKQTKQLDADFCNGKNYFMGKNNRCKACSNAAQNIAKQAKAIL